MYFLDKSTLDRDCSLLSNPRLTKVCIFHIDDFECVSKMSGVDVVVVFCPYIYQHVKTLVPQLPVVFPLAITSQADPFWLLAERRARRASVILETALSALNVAFINHWQFDFFLKFVSYHSRWRELARSFSCLRLAGRFIIPSALKPWRYGFYSMIPGREIAAAIGHEVSLTVVNHQSLNCRLLREFPSPPTIKSGEAQCSLNYLPATNAHQPEIQKIILSQKSIILTSPYYNTPYFGDYKSDRSLLSWRDARKTLKLLRAKGVNIYSVYDEILSGLIGDDSDSVLLSEQRKLFVDDLLKQLYYFYLIENSLSNVSLNMLNISGHVTPLHGPLFSFAARRGLDVNIYPHSYFQCFTLPNYEKTKLLAHPVQREVWDQYRLSWRQTVPWSRVLHQEGISELGIKKQLRRVLIVLNGSGTSHTCFINAAHYFMYLAELIALCSQMQVQCILRPKPNANFTHLLKDYLSEDVLSMCAFDMCDVTEQLETCDMVIMYDTDTSFGIQCLDRGIPLIFVTGVTINPSFDLLFFESDVVPRFTIYEAVKNLQNWARSRESFRSFGMRQMERYLKCSGGSK
jgi:hypothetical protein